MSARYISRLLRKGVLMLAFGLVVLSSVALEPVPDKLVVLTFDDSVASHYSVVRPLLKQHGFGGTFFITEGFSFKTNKQDYMTWEQIAELHRDGFEIGNHTRDHLGVNAATLNQLKEQVEAINARCAEHGIPKPISFAFPGNAIYPGALHVLQQLGIQFARRGGAPEHLYEWGRGFAYEPGKDHPLLIPSAGDARPDWTLDDFKRAVAQAKDGRIAVIQFHGVPDRDHPWVHTPPARFEEYLKFLADEKFKVIALRDLARYVDPKQAPSDPMAIVEQRKLARAEVLVESQIVDAASGEALPARVYIQSKAGEWAFPKSVGHRGGAVRYQRRNASNTNATEMHTAVSAHPFRVELTPGEYQFTIERGKEYFPEIRTVRVERAPLQLKFGLRRWINMAEQGWYSGDAHAHREPGDLPVTMMAEDVNVVLPMIYWTTEDSVSPAASSRNFRGDFGDRPVAVDATHVWHPRNTEYEIFRSGNRNHTLGAFLILNHRTVFDLPVFPLRDVAARAHREGALIDLEKHNWPWSIAVVPLLNVDLFELANNHHWRTEFAIRNWAVPAPAWMQLDGNGSGIDTEEAWTFYGFKTYYALLNCGFPLRPTAGTANGVHPVPLGFSRVYVHLDGPFSFEGWMNGLKNGRSFVTTGPMLLAQLNAKDPGHRFAGSGTETFRLTGRTASAGPLDRIEVIINGEVAQTLRPENKQLDNGSFESGIHQEVFLNGSSWVAVRAFEKLSTGRLRFAHTAPWHFEVKDKPLRPRAVEVEYFIKRIEEEIARNTGVLPEAALAEYRTALEIYRKLR